jgi:hypothetical protein
MSNDLDPIKADVPHVRMDGARSLDTDRADASISAADFLENFGEDLRTTLDVTAWRVGSDLVQEYSRIEREVRESVERETALQADIRARVFPALKRPGAPPNAGKHRADQKLIEKIHAELLFRGGMEACDGAVQVHDTLPLTIFQMGVTLVSYQGDQGSWSQRLFRRELKQSGAHRVDEVMAMLERRSPLNEKREGVGELVRKALLDFAERAILLRRGRAPWRMGHGNPVTYELLTGGGNLELMVEATNVVRKLVERHQKFVFVAQEPGDSMLLTVGHALQPLEYAIVSTLDERLEHWLHQKRFTAPVGFGLTWDGQPIAATEWIPRFIRQVASRIVVGLFRATRVAPAQVFYAHVDHAEYAAHMVLADAVLQEHRGFPMLLDMARQVCGSVFANSLAGLAQQAYAAAGVPWRYGGGGSNP